MFSRHTKTAEFTRDGSRVYSARVPKGIAALWDAEAAAAGLSRSDWLRQAVDPSRVRITSYRPPRRPHRTADPALLSELASIGNNVNQIARSVNVAVLAGERVAALRALLAIRQQLDQLLAREAGEC